MKPSPLTKPNKIQMSSLYGKFGEPEKKYLNSVYGKMQRFLDSSKPSPLKIEEEEKK